MTYLLDTCTLSELVLPRPNTGVMRFFANTGPDDAGLSVMTVGELVKGVDELPAGKRRTTLSDWVHQQLLPTYRDVILGVDEPIATLWGRMLSASKRAGRPGDMVDLLIAATAIQHGLTIVTRNEKDFLRTGAKLLNPWADE